MCRRRNVMDPCKCFIMYAVNDPEGLRAVLREKLLRFKASVL